MPVMRATGSKVTEAENGRFLLRLFALEGV